MAPIDAEELERLCETLSAMSERHHLRDNGKEITLRFAVLKDALPARVYLDSKWDRVMRESTATQAHYSVAGAVVTLFCPEMMSCRDGIARGVGTLRHPHDFAVLENW